MIYALQVSVTMAIRHLNLNRDLRRWPQGVLTTQEGGLLHRRAVHGTWWVFLLGLLHLLLPHEYWDDDTP